MANKKERLTLSQYARRRGVSVSTVHRYIKQGRLKGAAFKRGNRWSINPEKTDKQIDASLDMTQPARKTTRRPGGGVDEQKATAEEQGTGWTSFQDARTIKEQYNAALRKLEYETKIGQKVDAEKVSIEIFNMTRQARDILLNIPARVAPVMVTVKDAKEAEGIIKKEIMLALEALSRAE